VDAKHQVIVHREAHGEGSKHDLLKPMMEGAEESFKVIKKEEKIFEETKVLADSGFHTKENMKMLEENKIDMGCGQDKGR